METIERPFAGEPMSYAFTHTVLGLAVAARTDKGVAALLIGDSRDGLIDELHQALAGAILTEDEKGMMHLLDEVACMFSSPARGGRFLLDLRGTELQLAVWEALRQVQPGDTISYGQLAKKLDISVTAQDVGAACAANRVAVAVPCHRVVKADGSISGYRWGVHRKRKLINLEGVA
jgi:AraC family transcriptional regulator of adaptative response/methylated-DNA-[protein]-cysteine methyltransferase